MDNRPYFFICQGGIGVSTKEIRTREAAVAERAAMVTEFECGFDIEEYPAHVVEHEARQRAYIREMSQGG